MRKRHSEIINTSLGHGANQSPNHRHYVGGTAERVLMAVDYWAKSTHCHRLRPICPPLNPLPLGCLSPSLRCAGPPPRRVCRQLSSPTAFLWGELTSQWKLFCCSGRFFLTVPSPCCLAESVRYVLRKSFSPEAVGTVYRLCFHRPL